MPYNREQQRNCPPAYCERGLRYWKVAVETQKETARQKETGDSGRAHWEAGRGRHEQFPPWCSYTFLFNLFHKANLTPRKVAELAPQAQKRRMITYSQITLLFCEWVCFGQTEKFKPSFVAFQTADCDDLASSSKFAKGPRKRNIIWKHWYLSLFVVRYSFCWHFLWHTCTTLKENWSLQIKAVM